MKNSSKVKALKVETPKDRPNVRIVTWDISEFLAKQMKAHRNRQQEKDIRNGVWRYNK